MLETMDLTKALDRESYVREMTRRQIQMRELGYQVFCAETPGGAGVLKAGTRAGEGGRNQADHGEAGPARVRGVSDQRAQRARTRRGTISTVFFWRRLPRDGADRDLRPVHGMAA